MDATVVPPATYCIPCAQQAMVSLPPNHHLLVRTNKCGVCLEQVPCMEVTQFRRGRELLNAVALDAKLRRGDQTHHPKLPCTQI